MRIAETASVTNTGRVRRNNEDSYLADPPLFVVADGMGGAQAGELASRLTIDVFAGGLGAGAPEERLAGAIDEANRRVVERSRDDPHASGMGTTVTAALVDGDRVSFGHVGDSRAYLWRGGRLQQLSRDHSLVGELERQGRLTSEEAAAHPQRSVITRALGPAEQVDADTWTVEGQAGDVFLLCSDGLTDLVDDRGIAAVLAGERPLPETLRSLVRAANEGGGIDNITAIAFRLGEGEPDAPLPESTAPGRDALLEEDTLTEADRVPVVQAPPAGEPPPPRRFLPPEEPRRQRRPLRAIGGVTLVVVLAVLAVAGAIYGLRWSHFVGVDPETGDIGVYQGLPFEITHDHSLYRLVFRSRVAAASLPAAERRKLLDHELRSKDDARAVVDELARTEP